MSNTTTTTTTEAPAPAATLRVRAAEVPPDLPQERYANLKKELIKPEHYEAVKASWKRLLAAMEEKVAEIKAAGSSYVPEIEFSAIEQAGFTIPAETAKLVKERGCLIVRGVVSEEETAKWKQDLLNYREKHPEITGAPAHAPNIWYVHWSKAQTEARSHPRVMQLMRAASSLYNNADPDALVDMDSQVVFPDRLRIRLPGIDSTLNLHLDASSIERWEDKGYRDVYREIFEGRWEDWNPNEISRRPQAVQNLYHGQELTSTSSVFRAYQGWLALSEQYCGEGTVRFLPDLRCTLPYLLLRPFFWKDDGEIDLETTKFPGARPGYTQLLVDSEDYFPHLRQKESVVGISHARPGDFVLWHTDLPHEVDDQHTGNSDSSAIYIPHAPLCPYNIETLLDSREGFLTGRKPRDFEFELNYGPDESSYSDRGQEADVLTEDGLRALGLKKFDLDEPGITPGQREVRKLANQTLFGDK